jgi:hypothetical protein
MGNLLINQYPGLEKWNSDNIIKYLYNKDYLIKKKEHDILIILRVLVHNYCRIGNQIPIYKESKDKYYVDPVLVYKLCRKAYNNKNNFTFDDNNPSLESFYDELKNYYRLEDPSYITRLEDYFNKSLDPNVPFSYNLRMSFKDTPMDEQCILKYIANAYLLIPEEIVSTVLYYDPRKNNDIYFDTIKKNILNLHTYYPFKRVIEKDGRLLLSKITEDEILHILGKAHKKAVAFYSIHGYYKSINVEDTDFVEAFYDFDDYITDVHIANKFGYIYKQISNLTQDEIESYFTLLILKYGYETIYNDIKYYIEEEEIFKKVPEENNIADELVKKDNINNDKILDKLDEIKNMIQNNIDNNNEKGKYHW